jgi:hypothetical protein
MSVRRKVPRQGGPSSDLRASRRRPARRVLSRDLAEREAAGLLRVRSGHALGPVSLVSAQVAATTPRCPYCEADLSTFGATNFSNLSVGAIQAVLVFRSNCSKALGIVAKPDQRP